MQLRFSQEPTPSGQLSNPFDKLCLTSQPHLSQLTQDRPPVPMFFEDCLSSQQPQEMLCSQEVLGTQDFITPVDQFQLDYDPADKAVLHQRSPARLSPNRVKRPRKDEEAMADDDDSTNPSELRSAGPVGPSGRGPDQAPGRVVPRRAKSPPCYRNMFCGEDEDGFASWRAPRGGPGESRYRTDFKEIGLLGQGNFSRVARVRHRLNGQEYAVKRSIRTIMPDSPTFTQFLQEAQVMACMAPHPYIVQYYTSWTEPGQGGEYLLHQLEKCDISLGSLIAMRETFKEADVLEVLRQMCLALQHLHSHGVAHLDVKPDNIYGTELDDDNRPRVYKLGDFGQATRFDSQGRVAGPEQAVNEGDCRYLPLELLNADFRWLDKADMFALGATLFELSSRSELPTGGQLYQDLRHGKVPLLPNISTSLLKLIRSLLSLNPEERPSAEKVLASSLLNKKPAATLQSQGSNVSGQSTQTGDVKYGGLVLQRSVHS